MATQTVAVAGGNWSASATWTPGSVPAAGDDVVLNVSSGNLTIDVTTNAIRSINCTGFTGTITHNAAVTLTLGGASAGNFTFVSGITYTLGNATTSAISFTHTVTGNQVTSGGKTLGNVTFNGTGGGWILQDGFTTGSTATVILSAGTLNTNGTGCSWGSWARGSASVAVLTLGSSAITLTGAAGVISVATNGNFTVTVNTATFTCTGASPQVAGLGANWNGASLIMAGSGTRTLSSSDTWANITFTGSATKTDIAVFGGNPTVTGTLTFTGNSVTNRLLVVSSTAGTQRTVAAAASSSTNVDLQDITAAGAAAPFTGTSLGNCLGNSNITFDAPTTVYGVAAGNWSSVATWASSSGGTSGTGRVPLPQDTAVLDANSGAGTYTMDMPRIGANLTCTGFTRTLATNVLTNSVFGNWTLVSGMTFTNTQAIILQGRGTQTFASGGQTYTGQVQFNGPGSTYNLQDALVITSAQNLTVGQNTTLTTNNFNVTASAVVGVASTTGRTYNFGTSTITLTGTSGALFGSSTTTYNCSQTTFVISAASSSSRTFGPGTTIGALTYTVANSPGALAITGANTFTTLTVASGRQLLLPASTITSLTAFNVNGVNNGYLYLPGVAGNYASSPSAAPLNMIGDLTLDANVSLAAWTPAVATVLVAKYTGTAATSAYLLQVSTGGLLQLLYSNGTTITTVSSTVATGLAANATQWVRATRQQSTGATQFYTSPDGVTWTQLGTTVTSNAGTALTTTTQILELGSDNTGATGLAPFSLYEARIYASYQGTGSSVFDANLATKAFGANSFTESSSNAATVTINGILAQCGDGRVMLNSSTGGTQATVFKQSGSVSVDYLSIQDSKATGVGWYAGPNSINVSNNSGWSFGASGTDPSGFFGLFD